jgi:hypothetical protein
VLKGWKNYQRIKPKLPDKTLKKNIIQDRLLGSRWIFERFIYGRWYIYLEQTIYHLCRPISCWLSSLAVEYHLLWTIMTYVGWYSSPADDIQLKQMILNWWGWYSSRANDIHTMAMIFIQEGRISSMMVDSWNYNQPMEMEIPNYLLRKISNIHFYDNRQKTIFFQFIT